MLVFYVSLVAVGCSVLVHIVLSIDGSMMSLNPDNAESSLCIYIGNDCPFMYA